MSSSHPGESFIRSACALAQREKSDQSEARYSMIDWDHYAEDVAHYLWQTAQILNATHFDTGYKFYSFSFVRNSFYRQIGLKVVRQGEIPSSIAGYPRDRRTGRVRSSVPLRSEREAECQLILSATNTGEGIVQLHPHSSSNGELHEKFFVLDEFRTICEFTSPAGISRLNGLIVQFLKVHGISRFEGRHNRSTEKYITRLTERTRKWRRRYASDDERAREQFRIDWALGAAVVAGFLVAMTQAFAAAISEGKSTQPIAVLGATLLAFAYVLHRLYKR